MALAVVHSRALQGMQAPPVTVEVHTAGGLPRFGIVGLAETEVKEARDRVKAALQNARFEFPPSRITVRSDLKPPRSSSTGCPDFVTILRFASSWKAPSRV